MNYRKGEGKQFTFSAGAKVEAGDVVISGGLVGVAPYPVASGATGIAERSGEFVVAYDGAASATLGATAYWNTTSKYATAASSGATSIGFFAAAVTSGAETCNVILK